jgi:pSer/pThr/pTyr-binding forkhead associated (FHA) protein
LAHPKGGLHVRRDGAGWIVIADETVSLMQSTLLFDESAGRCTIEDMDSKNGTLLNGERIAFGEATQLTDGDTLAMGELRFLFYYPAGLYDVLRESAGPG